MNTSEPKFQDDDYGVDPILRDMQGDFIRRLEEVFARASAAAIEREPMEIPRVDVVRVRLGRLVFDLCGTMHKVAGEVAKEIKRAREEFKAGTQVLNGDLALMTLGGGVRGDTRTSPAGKGQDALPTSVERVFDGPGCLGRLGIELATGDRVRFTFAMEDETGRHIVPFYLTVTGADGGCLVERKRFNDWSGVVNEVPMAEYRFLVEDEGGGRRVEMWVRPSER